MSTLREAAVMALTEMTNARDYIWLLNEGGIGVSEKEMLEKMAKTIIDLRAALEKQTVPSDYLNSHQPVAWMDREGDLYKMPEIEGWAPPHTLLYTAPPQRKPLTDEEVDALINSVDSLGIGRHVMHKVARAIEKAHKIGEKK